MIIDLVIVFICNSEYITIIHFTMRANKFKYSGNEYDQGYPPLSKMAILTVEKMLECLKEAGLTKCADLLKSESKSKKVIHGTWD